MKTKLLFIILCIFMLSSCVQNQNRQKTDWEYDGLKGAVKTLKSVDYNTITDSAGQTVKGEIIDVEWGYYNTLLKYTPKGQWFEYTSYKPSGDTIRKEILVLDENEFPVARNDYNYGVFAGKMIYKNDGRGNMVELLRYTATDSLISKNSYKHDAAGNDIEILRYTATDSLKDKEINKYDAAGNCIERNNYDANNILKTKTVYTYNQKNQRIEISNFDGAGNLTKKTVYQYNEQNHWTEASIYNADGNLTDKTEYRYKYDKQGNWIEQIDFKDNKAVRITERVIVYYE